MAAFFNQSHSNLSHQSPHGADTRTSKILFYSRLPPVGCFSDELLDTNEL